MIPEVLRALVHDFLVKIQLVAAAARTGLEDGARIVIPLQASVWLVPVDSPAKVGRVDVAGQTLLVAVQLVTDKVHLAGQGGVVALGAEVMGVGGQLRGDLRCVVKGTNLHGKQAGNHAHARWGAERRRAVG